MSLDLRTYGLAALGLALVAALVWGFTERSRADGYKADVAVISQQHAEAVTRSVTAALAVTNAYRAEETRREAAKQEAIGHANEQTKLARAAERAATAERDGMRADFARYRAVAKRAAANSPAGSASPTGADPLDLLADMFGQSDDLAGQLAKEADRSRIAGLTCERQYDSLIGASP